MKILSCSAVAAAALAAPAMACDLCSVYSATQARGEMGAGFYSGLAEQFSHFGTVQVDGREIRNETGQYLDSSISQLFAGYNFNERFGLQLNLPVIYRAFKRPEGFATDRGTESGIGDTSLIGNFLLYRKLRENFTFSATLLGGLKFPTGSSDRLKEELHEVEVEGAPESGIHGHDLVLGTGSVDGVVGGGLRARWKRCFVTAAAQYAIRTEGDFGYQFADDLTWAGGPGAYLALGHKYTLALQAVVSGETKEKDTFRGARADDTGVTAVYLGPQVSFTWSNKLSAQVGVDLPVSMDTTALQTVPDYRVRAGFTWHF